MHIIDDLGAAEPHRQAKKDQLGIVEMNNVGPYLAQLSPHAPASKRHSQKPPFRSCTTVDNLRSRSRVFRPLSVLYHKGDKHFEPAGQRCYLLYADSRITPVMHRRYMRDQSHLGE